MIYLRQLFTGLTLVFAWVPATLLMVFVGYAVFSVVHNWTLVALEINLTLLGVSIGGCIGYIGLSSVCWPVIRLGRLKQLGFLVVGVLTLIIVIILGEQSQNELLMISSAWLDWYLFVSPLVFSSLHICLLWIEWVYGQSKEK